MDRNRVPLGGIILIVCGVLFALKVFDIISFGFWFWVGIMITISSVASLFREKKRVAGSLFGIFMGVILMLASLDLVPGGKVFPLFVAAVLLVAGIRIIIGKNDDNRYEEREAARKNNSNPGNTSFNTGNSSFNTGNSSYKETTAHIEYDEFGNARTVYADATLSNEFRDRHTSNEKGEKGQHYSAVFSGRNITYAGEQFDGVSLSTYFGSMCLNLRNAIVTGEVVVDAAVVLGSIEVLAPSNVNVILDCTPVLGSCSNKTITPTGVVNCPTIRIKASCVLGSVDVKY